MMPEAIVAEAILRVRGRLGRKDLDRLERLLRSHHGVLVERARVASGWLDQEELPIEDLNPGDYQICHYCPTIHRQGDDSPHFAMPAMGLRCTDFYGRDTNNWDDLVFPRDTMAWQAFVTRMTAREGQCPVCGQRIRTRKDERLIRHLRPPTREQDGLKRRVDCEGSGQQAVVGTVRRHQ